jgi:hypothetical protein
MTLSTHINNALKSAQAYADAIDLARKDAKGMTHDQVRAVILPIVASNPKYSVPVIDGKGKSKGTKVLDSTHAKYETARKAVNRLLGDICGDEPVTSSGAQEQIILPKGLLNNMVSKIIEAELDKDQFNALIAELRASVSFQ